MKKFEVQKNWSEDFLAVQGSRGYVGYSLNMFLVSTHQYRQLYFWLIKLKVDEKYYSRCWSAGDFVYKTSTAPKLGLGLGAELGKMMEISMRTNWEKSFCMRWQLFKSSSCFYVWPNKILANLQYLMVEKTSIILSNSLI